MLHVREEEVQLHVPNFRIPYIGGGETNSSQLSLGECADLLVNLQNSSSRTFCVDSFDWMSDPACIFNS